MINSQEVGLSSWCYSRSDCYSPSSKKVPPIAATPEMVPPEPGVGGLEFVLLIGLACPLLELLIPLIPIGKAGEVGVLDMLLD